MGNDSESANDHHDRVPSASAAEILDQRIIGARRRLQSSAQELLRNALLIAHLDDTASTSELEIALDTVRAAATNANLH